MNKQSASWRRLLAPALLVIFFAAAAGAAGAYWMLARYTAHVPLRDQSLEAILPPDLPVRVEVLSAQGAAGAEGSDDAQGVPVRLHETLHLNADFDAEVPLRMTVHYRGEIPVKAQVPVNTQIQTRVLGIAMTLPIQGAIPLDLKLPVDLVIPVNQAVRLKFSAPVTARVDQVVHIPLRAELDTRIRFTDATIPIRVRRAELELPLKRLSLSGPALVGGGLWTFGPLAPQAPGEPGD